jgi:hypothetical protein
MKKSKSQKNLLPLNTIITVVGRKKGFKDRVKDMTFKEALEIRNNPKYKDWVFTNYQKGFNN